jgi:hypothetical protein
MNCYFLVRILTRMKPVNFVLYEILHTAGTRMALVVGSVFLTVFSVPAMMVFFACMLEQKNFKDGIAESRRILKGMAKGRTAFSSVKPVSYFRTGPYIRCSDGDSSGPGDFICKGLYSHSCNGHS